MSSPENLRTRYQESAAQYLNKCIQLRVAEKNGTGRKVVKVHKQNKCPELKNKFDPILTARSLMLRSMYANDANQRDQLSIYDSKCIVPGISKVKNDTYNLVRSGGKVVKVPAQRVEDLSLAISNGQKHMFQDNVRVEADFCNLADDIANKMFSSSSLASDNERNTVRDDFLCKCCGNFLFPCDPDGGMPCSIKIRTLKRGRTRRRRASRYTAKKHTFDTHVLQKNKGGGRTFAQSSGSSGSASHGVAVMEVMDTHVALKMKSMAGRTRDGLAKNCIRYKCECGHLQSMKGLKRSLGDRMDKSINKYTKSTKHYEKVSQKSGELKRQKVGEEEFISLGGGSKYVETKTETKVFSLKKKSNQRKAQNKKPAKKSGLQDFLSSLND